MERFPVNFRRAAPAPQAAMALGRARSQRAPCLRLPAGLHRRSAQRAGTSAEQGMRRQRCRLGGGSNPAALSAGLKSQVQGFMLKPSSRKIGASRQFARSPVADAERTRLETSDLKLETAYCSWRRRCSPLACSDQRPAGAQSTAPKSISATSVTRIVATHAGSLSTRSTYSPGSSASM